MRRRSETRPLRRRASKTLGVAFGGCGDGGAVDDEDTSVIGVAEQAAFGSNFDAEVDANMVAAGIGGTSAITFLWLPCF